MLGQGGLVQDPRELVEVLHVLAVQDEEELPSGDGAKQMLAVVDHRHASRTVVDGQQGHVLLVGPGADNGCGAGPVRDPGFVGRRQQRGEGDGSHHPLVRIDDKGGVDLIEGLAAKPAQRGANGVRALHHRHARHRQMAGRLRPGSRMSHLPSPET